MQEMNIFKKIQQKMNIFISQRRFAIMKITRTLILCSLSLLLVVMSFVTAPDEGENIVPVSTGGEETSVTTE